MKDQHLGIFFRIQSQSRKLEDVTFVQHFSWKYFWPLYKVEKFIGNMNTYTYYIM